MVLSYLLAVLAACANATSSVLQRKANRDLPRQQNMSWRLIWSLLHQPVWFGGILAICFGFLLQATALGFGQLATVEPILVLELPLTLVLASRVFHQHMQWREWAVSGAMALGLGGLLFFLSPTAGHRQHISWYAWAIGIGVNLAVVGALALAASRQPTEGRRSAYRAALLGIAAGTTFGLTAALMKGMTETFKQGITTLFSSWEIYGMVAAGLLGMFLVQSAMNAGKLLAAQPGLTMADPVVSVLWGVLAFSESVRGSWFILPEVACVAILGAGAVALARSPLLSDTDSDSDDSDTDAETAASTKHSA